MNGPTSSIQYESISSDELRPFDVLCGRDKKSYNNIGNRRFRILINLNLPRYLQCQSRNERSEMILSLTRELCTKSTPVRFFKRSKENIDSMDDELIELDFKDCREKIGHALRDAASQYNNSSKNKEAIAEQKQQKDEQESHTMIRSPINNDDSSINIINLNCNNNVFPSTFDNEEDNDVKFQSRQFMFHKFSKSKEAIAEQKQQKDEHEHYDMIRPPINKDDNNINIRNLNCNNNVFPSSFDNEKDKFPSSIQSRQSMFHKLQKDTQTIPSEIFETNDDNRHRDHRHQIDGIDGTYSLMSDIEPLAVFKK